MALAGIVIATGKENTETMDPLKHDPELQMEFEKEWHHLRCAMKAAELVAVVAFVAAVAYSIRAYFL